MSGLATLIARSATITGNDTSQFNLGGRSILGWGSSRSLADTGIVIGGQSVANARNAATFSGQSYADITTTRSSWFGLSRSTSTSRETQALGDALVEQISRVIGDMADAIFRATLVLAPAGTNVDEFGQQLGEFINSINLDGLNISFKDLAGDDLQKALEAAFSALGDTMTASVLERFLPGVIAFQRIGEGLFETLVRVASGVEKADSILLRFGLTAINYADVINTQGDVAVEIVRQTIIAVERTLSGGLTGVGDIIDRFNGSIDDLATLYQKLMDIRVLLRAIGSDSNDLNQAMITGAGGLSRFTSGLQSFSDGFFSEAERIQAMWSELDSQFAALGVSAPRTNEAFRQLVEGIDRTTPAGQALYGAVISLSPAFLRASQAAVAATNNFLASMAAIYGAAFTQQQRQSQILALISQLSSLSPVIAALGSPAQILAGLGNIGPEVWQSFRDANAGNSAILSLIDQIAALYAAIKQGESGSGSGDWLYNFGDGLKDLGATAASAAERLAQAKDALKGYMNSLLLNEQLSPLTPMDRLNEAKKQYEAMLALARTGDVDAIQGLSGSSETYLKIAREIFASSSAYNAIFRQVFGELGGVVGAGAPNFETAFAAALPVNSRLASSAEVVTLTQAVWDMHETMKNGIAVNDPQITEQTNAITSAVKRIGGGGALA